MASRASLLGLGSRFSSEVFLLELSLLFLELLSPEEVEAALEESSMRVAPRPESVGDEDVEGGEAAGDKSCPFGCRRGLELARSLDEGRVLAEPEDRRLHRWALQ